MGIIKKIIYYIRLFTALSIFICMIVISVCYFSGTNFFNIPFNGILRYVENDITGNFFKMTGIIAIITLVFGRIWCSLICPVGTFQEIIWLISRRENEKRKSYFFKYILMIISAIILFYFYKPILNFMLNNLFLMFSVSIVSIILIAILTIFKGRFFCSDICPFGAFFGLISKFSILKIHQGKNCMYCTMCESVCPSGCIDVCNEKVNNETCIKCLRCFNACSENGMKYGFKIF